MEQIEKGQTGNFEYAVFDFDGTLSLIREGWQKIMVPYFIDELSKAPGAKQLSSEEIDYKVRDFVTVLTGKQTIYQCIRLAEEITALGGTPEDPQVYKDEYQRRLLVHIDERLKGLKDGSLDPEPLTVPGHVSGFRHGRSIRAGGSPLAGCRQVFRRPHLRRAARIQNLLQKNGH